MLKLIILLLMTFCLSGCRTFETKLVCGQIAKHQIKPLPMCDVSFQFARCRCRCFDYNSWDAINLKTCERFKDEVPTLVKEVREINGEKIIKEVEVVDFNIGYCEGVAGFFVSDAALHVKPQIKALHTIYGNLCQ